MISHPLQQESLSLLQSRHWPGNVRELQNVVERAVSVSESAGIPSSTLESRIKMLKIDKRRFKPQVTDWTARAAFSHA